MPFLTAALDQISSEPFSSLENPLRERHLRRRQIVTGSGDALANNVTKDMSRLAETGVGKVEEREENVN